MKLESLAIFATSILVFSFLVWFSFVWSFNHRSVLKAAGKLLLFHLCAGLLTLVVSIVYGLEAVGGPPPLPYALISHVSKLASGWLFGIVSPSPHVATAALLILLLLSLIFYYAIAWAIFVVVPSVFITVLWLSSRLSAWLKRRFSSKDTLINLGTLARVVAFMLAFLAIFV